MKRLLTLFFLFLILVLLPLFGGRSAPFGTPQQALAQSSDIVNDADAPNALHNSPMRLLDHVEEYEDAVRFQVRHAIESRWLTEDAFSITKRSKRELEAQLPTERLEQTNIKPKHEGKTVVSGTFSCDNVTQIPQAECEALVAFYKSTDGPNWANNYGWLATDTPCDWRGIYCSNSQISGIHLIDNYLSGNIPAQLGQLSNLLYLSLPDNQLSGTIPTQLGQLSNLESLFLDDNQLSGNIPPELGQLNNLQLLDLSYNQLSGTIPAELGQLNNLQLLSLYENQLSGNIPPQLGQLSNLEKLDLSDNQLSGNIAPQLGQLSNLQELQLYGNQLSGNIPAELGQLSHLQSLQLQVNQLSGNIPPELGQLSNLKSLYLNKNRLSGNIPSELGQLSHLSFLILADNQLSGNIPPELGQLSNLQYLSINDNQLSGPLPLTLTNLDSISSFRFHNTDLCEPSDLTFQRWLTNINNVMTTGITCSSSCPTPESGSGNEVLSVPVPPAQSRRFGSVTVYADSFNDRPGGWSANGTVWLGDYIIIEKSTVNANPKTLTGSGLVSMITKADRCERTLLFRDSFTVDTSSRILTPQAVSGYEFRLKKLAGFNIQKNSYDLSVNLNEGRMSGNMSLALVIPNNNVVETLGATLDHTGAINGSFEGEATFSLGSVMLTVSKATLGHDGLTINQANLKLPEGFGGTKAEFSVRNARITGSGEFTLAKGNAMINFPNVHVGGENGFAIEGAKATLSIINGNSYKFRGAGTFVLPGVGSNGGNCRIGTIFEFMSTPPPLREATLSIDGCAEVPIGTTGFFLTGVNGSVTLDENTVAIDIGVTVEGGPEIEGIGRAISGNPTAHWDNSWAVGLNGDVKLFGWDAAEGNLTLSARKGLEGTLHISVLGVIDGNGRLHVWKDNSTFHFTGQATVTTQIKKGAIINKCSSSGIELCVLVPPTNLQGPSTSADFGEFRTSTSDSTYGLKGRVSILGYHPAFFVDVNRHIRFALDGLQEYALVDQPALTNMALLRGGEETYSVAVGDTPTLLVALARDKGNLTLSLTDPTGRLITPSITDSDLFYTNTLTQTLYTVATPPIGNWTVTVGNRTGNEQYLLNVLGAPILPTLSAPTLTSTSNGYQIDIQATGAPTATYSLFYDDDATGNDGQPIATGLALSQTSVEWNTSTVPEGNYYVYALVDDPYNAPIVAYSTKSVNITDNIAPDTPTNLQVTSTGTDATFSWQPSTAADVAGYRIYYSQPDGNTFVANVPNGQQTHYTQQGLYLNGDWNAAISAYDINGNESPRSTLVSVTIDLNMGTLYLPLVIR